MAGINKVILVGNLGVKPELKTASNGNKFATMSLATSETWKDRNTGERREKTEWHKIVIWGKLAEIAAQYCDKGTKVYLEGKNETRSWEDERGEKRYITEVVLSGFNSVFQMMDKRENVNTGVGVGTMEVMKAPLPSQPETTNPVDNGGFSDDIPF
jgi:single-strand DNA-binding protein